jgi:choice-of-anchor B domain-containing protein
MSAISSHARRVVVLACVVIVCVAPAAHAGDRGISVVGQLNMPNATIRESDVTGWVDPVTLKEYAAVGQYPNNEVFIIDCSNPAEPAIVATLVAPGFDLKYWNGFLYLVTGSEAGSGKVYNVSDPTSPTFLANFKSGHNIFITDDGFMYKETDGLKIFDLNQVTGFPIRIFTDNTLGGHDATVIGNRCYDFHGNYTAIWDVTNPAAPTVLGTITDPTIMYDHSGWTDKTETYLYLNDELSRSPYPDFSVWNVSNPASPVRVNEYNDPDASIHNSFRVGDYLFCSYYVAGFRVFDLTDPASPVLYGEYDTSPGYTGEGQFEGAWGCYPFQPSGNIYVSDSQTGLWIFRFDPDATTSVAITRFVAAYHDGFVRLDWSIGAADGLEGFHVYRSDDRERGYARVNDALLPGNAAFAFDDGAVEPGRTYHYRLGAIDRDGEVLSPIQSLTIPVRTVQLEQNHPNPFNPHTRIAFETAQAGDVTLAVYSPRGERVRTLASGHKGPGRHVVVWNGRNDAGSRVSSGAYFYRLRANGETLTRRMILLK